MAKVAIVDGIGDGATGGRNRDVHEHTSNNSETEELPWCQLCRHWRCHQWRQSWYHGNSCFSVNKMATTVFNMSSNTMIMPIHIICHRHFGAGLLSKLSRDQKDAQIRYFLVWKQKFCAKFSFQGPGLINYLSIYSAFAQDRIGNFEKWHPNTQGWSNVHFID